MESTEFSFMLKPSPFGGVGVFATHDIPKGSYLFHYDFEMRILNFKEVPEPLRKYCIHINDEVCLCPERFDRMEIGWYINHSSTPNIGGSAALATDDPVKNIKEYALHALEAIKAGEEIFIDYNYFAEPEHLKEQYYKVSELALA